MIDISAYQKVARCIRRARRVALCIHMFPDGDAIGSMVALALCLKKMGKRVVLFSPSELPRRYRFLPLYANIRQSASGAGVFDLAIALDCASKVQLDDLYLCVFQKALTTIEIDHHSFRKKFAQVSLIDDKAAAVGEIIYKLARLLRVAIGQDIAIPLLVSLIVETGSFRLPSVTPATFRICADLTSRGVNYYDIVEKSYWSRTRAEAMLLGLCFSRIKFSNGGRLAISHVTSKDLKRLKAQEEDVDPMIDQIRTLKEVRVAMLFREMPGHLWRVSLRSKGSANVGRVAEAFGGGGHPDVAGCFIPKTSQAKQELIRRVSKIV
ncbi:MAG: DHH family phosphoesterase [Candidatus Omnitrophota bacterium]